MRDTGLQQLPSVLARHPRWHGIAYWGLLAVACAMFLVMNVYTTFKEDDMAFSLMEGEWTPVRSLVDLLRSHTNLYLHANGRTANLVAALFCALLGKGLFNVCNTLVFGLLAHLTSLLTTGRRSLLALSMFLVSVGTCYPVPGETLLWLDGSCNYLWAITLSLALVWYLMRSHDPVQGWARGLALFLAALVAGSFNEATSFGMLAGLALYYLLNRSQCNRQAAIFMAGYLLGVAIIVASPGAWARAASGDISVNMALPDLLHSRWHIFSEKMWRFYLPVVACLVGIAALVMGRWREVRRSPWTWILLCLALVMFALGQTSERAYAPLVTVALIVIIIAAHVLTQRWPWLRLAAVAVCAALTVFTYARGIVELRRYEAFNGLAVSQIRDSDDSQVVLHERQYDGYSRFIKLMNFMSNNFFAHEDIYRAYYGKANVQFVPDSVYVRFHDGRLLDGARACQSQTSCNDLVGDVYAFDNQDYVLVELKTVTLPGSFQTAQYRYDTHRPGNSPHEQQRRRDYGITIDYDPAGFYPLKYQGRCYLVCEKPADTPCHLTFPLWFHPGGRSQRIDLTIQ